MKKNLLILGLVVVFSVGGRAVWAYKQMKTQESVGVQQAPTSGVVAVAPAILTPDQSIDHPLTTTQTVEVHETSRQNGITVNANIKTDIVTTASCGTPECFQEKFYTCQPATLSADADGLGAVVYTILKPLDSTHCRVSFKYTKVLNPDWLNKDLTCTYRNRSSIDDDSKQYAFEEEVKNMLETVLVGHGGTDYEACEGAFYSELHPEKAAARAARQIPSVIKLDALNYTSISIAKINEYIGKQVSFKVNNPLPGMKFCMGSIRTRVDGFVEASNEIIAHDCGDEYPLVYDSATKTVLMLPFTTEVVSSIVRGFRAGQTDALASLVFKFYALETTGRESNHLTLTFTK